MKYKIKVNLAKAFHMIISHTAGINQEFSSISLQDEPISLIE